MKHSEISKSKHLARPCSAGDLFSSGFGLQCGNCLAYTMNHGKTWIDPDKKESCILKKN
jgi:hypothetical protein